MAARPKRVIDPFDIRWTVTDPLEREVYYRRETDEEYPYSRAVVDFRDSATRGMVISWSRYETPVASYGVKYRRGEP